jgi:hypothetical protein
LIYLAGAIIFRRRLFMPRLLNGRKINARTIARVAESLSDLSAATTWIDGVE